MKRALRILAVPFLAPWFAVEIVLGNNLDENEPPSTFVEAVREWVRHGD